MDNLEIQIGSLTFFIEIEDYYKQPPCLAADNPWDYSGYTDLDFSVTHIKQYFPDGGWLLYSEDVNKEGYKEFCEEYADIVYNRVLGEMEEMSNDAY